MSFLLEHLHLRERLIGAVIAVGSGAAAYWCAQRGTDDVWDYAAFATGLFALYGVYKWLAGPVSATKSNLKGASWAALTRSAGGALLALPTGSHEALIVGFLLSAPLAAGAGAVVGETLSGAALAAYLLVCAGMVWAHRLYEIWAEEKRRPAPPNSKPDVEWTAVIGLGLVCFAGPTVLLSYHEVMRFVPALIVGVIFGVLVPALLVGSGNLREGWDDTRQD